jgi:hypothetical protein
MVVSEDDSSRAIGNHVSEDVARMIANLGL